MRLPFFSHICPICHEDVLPKCFELKPDITKEELVELADIIEKKLAVHMVTSHPDEDLLSVP